MTSYNISEVQLIYKNKVRSSDRPQISCSEDAFNVFLQTWDDNKIDFIEQAKLMLLNRNNRVLGILDLSSGGVAGTVVDPKIVFVAALKANASSIILAHNHPSGSPKPSMQDIILTKDIREVGKRLTITLHDHILMCRDSYHSMADMGDFIP